MLPNPSIRGLDFSWSAVLAAQKSGRLLSFDIELSRRCNLRCIYCYARSGKALPDELTVAELKCVVDQAASLGAKRAVIIGGGEPMLHPGYWELLSHIQGRGLSSITFTNGTLITAEAAERLRDFGEDIALKFNAFDSAVQDRLAGGGRGVGRAIRRALDLLLEAGYSSSDGAPRLALETVICRANLREIEPIYRFCREKGLIPYVEILTLQGNAREYAGELQVESSELHALFSRLLRYDQVSWGISWPVVPPIVGQVCKRMFYSAYITSTGEVQPCPGVDISAGNLRKDSLASILARPTGPFRLARNILSNIQGHCRGCTFAIEEHCYGCRGTALHQKGGYLESDPTCWWPTMARGD